MNINEVKQQLNISIEKIKNSTNSIEINTIIETLIKSITGSEYSSIWVFDNRYTLLRERDNSTPRELSLEQKKGLLYKCFATKKTIFTNYLASEKNYNVEIDNPDNIKMKSKIMIPLIDSGNLIGIATAYSSIKQMKKFDSHDIELFNAIIPFIIDSVYKMKENSTTNQDNPKADRRKNNNNFTRRATDSINNLKSIEESMQNSQTPQEILDYVANIVHDIRTPSNGLFGFLEILEEQIPDARLKKYISHAKESALLINTLTTSILDSVSSKREISQSKKETVSSFRFFGDIAEMFSSTMHKKEINYNIFIDPLLPKDIVVESIKLKRIIMNLIGNASKFTPQNKTIDFSVRYKQKEKKIHIFVQDTGIGIAKEKQEQIFEAFKQAEDDTNLTYGGTGLGLAICAGYVKELGGKLSIDSKLDKGSTFYFDIPIEVQDEKLKFKQINNQYINIAILMSKKNSLVANNIARYLVKMGINVDKIKAISSLNLLDTNTTHLISFENMLSIDTFIAVKEKGLKSLVVEENFLTLNKNNLEGSLLISQYGYFAETLYNFADVKNTPKVLIVEDDEISILLLKTILSDEICTVDVAFNGEDGLRMLEDALKENQPYNIIYTDDNMPIMNGVEMIKKYKTVKKSEQTYCVSISGDISSDEDAKLYNIYIGKPFRKKDIKATFYTANKG